MEDDDCGWYGIFVDPNNDVSSCWRVPGFLQWERCLILGAPSLKFISPITGYNRDDPEVTAFLRTHNVRHWVELKSGSMNEEQYPAEEYSTFKFHPHLRTKNLNLGLRDDRISQHCISQKFPDHFLEPEHWRPGGNLTKAFYQWLSAEVGSITRIRYESMLPNHYVREIHFYPTYILLLKNWISP